MTDNLLGFKTCLSSDLDDLLSSDLTPSQAFIIGYFKSKFKKRLLSPSENLSLRESNLRGFIDRNNSLRLVSLKSEIIEEAKEFIEHALWTYFTSISDEHIQCNFDMDHVLSFWRHGPGASNGVSGTHSAEKFESMSVTAGCRQLLLRALSSRPELREFFSQRSRLQIVGGSRLTTVPKNESSVRTIAIEPSGNMLVQLSAGACLEGVLSGIGFDIRSQQIRNRFLAQSGSVDDSLATIDLSAASDSISVELVRLLWPDEWYRFFMCARSPSASVLDCDLKLNMMSTMGNGFTFPMMTLTFLSLVYANRRINHSSCSRRLFLDRSCTAVFGDDIIVPAYEYQGLVEVLEGAGFSVNSEKSYFSGPFRESCGGDYYCGVFMTPPYVRSVDSVQGVYIALNQLSRYCADHSVFLPRTFQFLLGLLDNKPLLVPEWESDDAGFRTCEVSRRYKKYVPSQVRVKYRGPWAMMLACGGYLLPSGDQAFFVPRPFKTKYRLVKDRLPSGYLSGRSSVDYCDRRSSLSSFIALWLSAMAG